MQLVERILRFVPDAEKTHFENILDEFEYRDSDEIAEALTELINYGFIEAIEIELMGTYYQRTKAGLFTVFMANEAAARAIRDNEIPF